MRVEPTFSVAEDAINKDFKLKLPNHTFIHMWNSPELADFRGYQEELNSNESKIQVAQREQADIQQAARDEGVHTPDMNMVAQMHHHQQQAAGAMQQHMDDLGNVHRQQLAGMQAEYRAELDRLGSEARAAANRDRVAQEATNSMHRDLLLEQRDQLGQLAQRQGVVTQYIDQSAVHNHYNQHVADRSIHDEAMNLTHANAEQFGRIGT